MSAIHLMPRPNLFVVGAMKAGTTALYSCLRSNPQIYMSPVKEPNFFSDDLWAVSSHIRVLRNEEIEQLVLSGSGVAHNALIKNSHQYQLLFPMSSQAYAYRGETSPSYLRSRNAALNISTICPDAKIIAIIRDPIERAWSHFLMERNESRVPYRFRDLIRQEVAEERKGKISQHGILESGLYYRMLSRFYDHFAPSSILIIDYCDLADIQKVFKKLDCFLGLSECCYTITSEANRTIIPRYPLANYLLASWGLKKLTRKIFPRQLIDMGKSKYYFRPTKADTMSADDMAYMLSYYAQDVKSLVEKIMSQSPPKWAEKYLSIS
ncbi:MAG: sulfotransferase family protein [Nitrospirota bacterium]